MRLAIIGDLLAVDTRTRRPSSRVGSRRWG